MFQDLTDALGDLFGRLNLQRAHVDDADRGALVLGKIGEQIGVVLQEPFLFHGTISDNIAYSKPGASKSEIVAAAAIPLIAGFATDPFPVTLVPVPFPSLHRAIPVRSEVCRKTIFPAGLDCRRALYNFA